MFICKGDIMQFKLVSPFSPTGAQSSIAVMDEYASAKCVESTIAKRLF
jgi:hypothetical protein